MEKTDGEKTGKINISEKTGLGIYIHIPFCVSKCSYCDFVSIKADNAAMLKYVRALIDEINSFPDNKEKYTADSIYIGGGTPSVMPAGAVTDIFSALYKNYQTERAEITLEANPGTLTYEKIKEYKNAGINRISLGLQSSDDGLLKKVGRIHTYRDFTEAVSIIKSEGIDNISADVMIALPGQTLINVQDTLYKAIDNGIKHISVYTLKVEEGTLLYGYKVDDDLAADMYDATADILTAAGYYRYEVSNFAQKGYESRHNLKYWQLKDYIGYGVAAHSFFEGKRSYNISDTAEYINGGNERRFETRNFEDFRAEYIMLSMRTADGLDLTEYKKLFNENILHKKKEVIEKQNAFGNLIVRSGRLKLTSKGFYIMNTIIVGLL